MIIQLTFSMIVLSVLQTKYTRKEQLTNGYARDSFYWATDKWDLNTSRYEIKNYPICSPMSSLECFEYNFNTGEKTSIGRPKPFCLWTGVEDEQHCPSKRVFEMTDEVVLRSAATIPRKLRSKVCTTDGAYLTERCAIKGEIVETQIPVVLSGNMWQAVVDAPISIINNPECITCWSVDGYRETCTDIQMTTNECLCIKAGCEALHYGDVLVDAHGTRKVFTIHPTDSSKKIDCTLSFSRNKWIVHSQSNLLGLRALIKKNKDSFVHIFAESTSFELPVRMQYQQGSVIVKVYEKDQLVCMADMWDDATDVCGHLYMSERITDWRCWGTLEKIVITCIILVVLLIICSILFITMIFIKFIRPMAEVIAHVTRFTGQVVRGAGRMTVRVLNGIRNFDEEHLRMACLLICLPFGMADQNCDNLQLASFNLQCSTEGCAVSGVHEFNVPASGSIICIKASDPKTDAFRINILVDELSYACNAGEEYFTADYAAAAEMKKYCPENCYNDVSKTAPEAPVVGFKSKHEAPGCAGNGCMRCDSACWAINRYWKRISGPVRIFKCTNWEPAMKVQMSIEINGLIKSQRFTLTKLQPVTFSGINLNWISNDFSPSIAYNKQFLAKDGSLCALTAAERNTLEKGKVGFVQCPDQDSTLHLRGCLQNPQDIACASENKDKFSCHAKTISWEETCKSSWLPVTIGSTTLVNQKGLPSVTVNSFGSIRLMVNIKEAQKVEVVTVKSSCNIMDGTIEGCFNCLEGATLTLPNTPSGGKAKISVVCEEGILPFSFQCGETKLKVNAAKTTINTKCEARWGLKASTFIVSGSLVRNINLIDGSETKAEGQSDASSWGGLKLPGFEAFKNILFAFFIIIPVGVGVYFLVVFCNWKRGVKKGIIGEDVTWKQAYRNPLRELKPLRKHDKDAILQKISDSIKKRMEKTS